MSEQQRNIGINGAGAIGTSLLRRNAILEMQGRGLPITTVAEEFLTTEQIAENVRHDKIYGPLGIEVEVQGHDSFRIGERLIQIVSGGVKSNVDWGRHGVWSVLEATGQRTDVDKAREHITAGGAQKVIITAPSKGAPAKSLIVGVNEHEYDPAADDVVDNASCTTKSSAHIIKALHEGIGIHSVSLATVHAETGPERRSLIQESAHVQDIRKLGFRPEKTGAQAALTKLFPGIAVNAKAYRVPTPDGSISDMTIRLKKASGIDEVRSIIAAFANSNVVQLINQPIVNSADLIGNPHDAVLSTSDIEMVGDDQVRIRAGYDNGFAPANAALELQRYIMAQR
jgi:glyceraldehyde-3-phosphate dehydrogenase type I